MGKSNGNSYSYHWLFETGVKDTLATVSYFSVLNDVLFASSLAHSGDCLLSKMKTGYRKLRHEYGACNTNQTKSKTSKAPSI